MTGKSNKLPDNPVARIRKRLGNARGKKMSQADLAEQLDVSEKYVSMLENGTRPVSQKIAKKILKISPPGTRIEWLMGEDPFETEKEKFDFDCTQFSEQSNREGIMEIELLKMIASRAGYAIKRENTSPDKQIPDYVFTDQTGKETNLPFFGSDGMQELWYDFFDYAAYRLKRMIDRKNASIRWTIEDDK